MALSSFGLEIGAENIGELCDRLYEAQYGRWAACSEPRIVRLRAGAGAHAVGRLGEGADAKGHGAEQGVEARLGAAVLELSVGKLRLLRGREVVADHFGASPVVEYLAGALRGAQDRGHVQGGSGFSKVDLPWRFLCDPQLLFSTKRLFEAIPGGSEEPFEEGFEDHVADEAASAHSQRAQARHRGFEAPLRPL